MKKHLIVKFILIAYSVILIKVMVFKDLPIIRIGPLMFRFGGTREGPANLVPFKTILPYLLGKMGWLIGGINLIGNIVLLVPIGFLVPVIFRNVTWKIMLALALATGFAIEGMQVVLHVGIFDIDDVILNALGVMIGYWAFIILSRWLHSRNYKAIMITTIIVIAFAGAVLYAMYPTGQPAANARGDAGSVQPDSIENLIADAALGVDPCNGTGGTGQIISLGNKTITIKGGNGVSQIIKLTDHTKIKTSLGLISESGLQIGNHVTVIIDRSETAAVVLVCNDTIQNQ